MTLTTKIFNVIYGLTVVFFFLDNFTNFDIKNQVVKSFVYYGILIGTPLTLICNALIHKTTNKKIIGTILPAIILIMILLGGPMKFFFSKGAWHTQTILYQYSHFKSKTVELQMQDCGALGYNKRTVEVLYLTPFFMITSDVPNDINKNVEWVKVDKDVNELELKFP